MRVSTICQFAWSRSLWTRSVWPHLQWSRSLTALLIGTLSYLTITTAPTTVGASDVREFSVDVMSILSKAGCNAGTCHGNLNGKGGFKLSLRGQDATHDYEALVHSSRGRRVNLTAPEESYFLQKAVGAIPHRGGVRFTTDSPEYRELVEWVRAGANGPSKDAVQLERLIVEPASAIVPSPQADVQISVTAIFADGTELDVSNRACYELSNLNAEVHPDGRVSRKKLGETTLIVRYLNQQVPVPIAFIESHPDFDWEPGPTKNLVDQHVYAKLVKLSLRPSPTSTDSVFLRRAYLDAIGRLPTVDEAKTFVADGSPEKREQLIKSLLTRAEFSDFWALKFADVLRVEEKVLDPKGVEFFHAWIRHSIEAGRPLDEFVRDLVTGVGNTFEHAPANYYRANRDASTRGETTARLFLGTRLQCAKCHNHPFDRWTQDDYYQWSSLFSQIDYEIGENKRKDKLDKNEFAGEQVVLISKQPEVKNPTTRKVALPKFLGGEQLSSLDANTRLDAVANWLTSPDNELFVKSQANFIWYQLMGRGLVEPIDDFRLTNPPSNPPLMDALANHLVENRFDIRSLIQTIMLSNTYQASAEPLATNAQDETSFSRAYVKRLPAEVLLDMQSDVLGHPAQFAGYEPGMRAVQIPGVQRVRPREKRPQSGDRFLKTFGKPERILACDCERSNETSLQQVLGLLGASLNERLEKSPNLRQLAKSELSDAELIDQLYWSALCRSATATEQAAARRILSLSPDRHSGTLDIAWALLNAKEFLFRR